MTSVLRAVLGLGALCAGLLVMPAAPALADTCAWTTPSTTVMHGTAFRLELGGDCRTPTGYRINGAAADFVTRDPDDPLGALVDTTELGPGSYMVSADDATGEIAVGTFAVDNTPPTVLFSDPAVPPSGQATVVSGVVPVTVTPLPAGTNGATISSVEALDPITGDPIDTVTAAQAATAGSWVLHFDTTGWANGPEDFSVLVNQDDGNQGLGSATFDVENQASTLAESIGPDVVAYGKPVTITGQLNSRAAAPLPLPGRDINLYEIPTGSTTATLLTSTPLVTNAAGNIKYMFTPKGGGHFYFAFAGEKTSADSATGFAPSTSPSRPLTVTSSVAFRLSSTHQPHGHAFSGFIVTSPGNSGVPFQIQIHLPQFLEDDHCTEDCWISDKRESQLRHEGDVSSASRASAKRSDHCDLELHQALRQLNRY